MDEIYVAESVFRIIKEHRQSVIDHMSFGNVKSMEHYRELIGFLDGLNRVEQELKSLLDKQERSND